MKRLPVDGLDGESYEDMDYVYEYGWLLGGYGRHDMLYVFCFCDQYE